MRNWFIGLTLILLVILWQLGQLTYHVMSEKNQWEEEGIALAKKNTAIKSVTKVSLFHGNHRYIVVEGVNASGIPMLAWFQEEGLFEGFEYMKDLVSIEQVKEKVKKDIPQAEFIRLQPGMENRRPLWEIVMKDQEGKIGYYYYDMKSGEFIRSYRLQKVSG